LQDNFLWEHLTFREHIEVLAYWRGMSKTLTDSLMDNLSKGLDIGKNMDIKAIDLSGGNKRKLNTFLALMSSPKVFILDEPTAGMDPSSRRFFWNVLKTWKQSSDCAIMLTTHTANEAEVIFIKNKFNNLCRHLQTR
jgi:ABC-type multidrug transport system ATPase subunit